MNNDINRRIAEKVMGVGLKPERNQAIVAVALAWLSVTGPQVTLKNGSKVTCPPWKSLPSPYPNAHRNDYYLLYIGQEMIRRGNAEFISDVDAYETAPPDYINDPAAVFGPGGVVEKMQARGYSLVIDAYGHDKNRACFYLGGRLPYAYRCTWAETITEAVCLAALAAVGGLQ